MSTTRPTRYTVYPDDYEGFVNSDRSMWTLKVELTDDKQGLWAIRDGGGCYNRRGVRGYEPQPSSRTDRWIKSHRFPLDEAIRIAEKACSKMRWNLRTAQEASDYVAARLAGSKS